MDFTFKRPNLRRILYRWVITVFLETFIIKAISFVVLPFFIRFATLSSVGERFSIVNFFAKGRIIFSRLDHIIST